MKFLIYLILGVLPAMGLQAQPQRMSLNGSWEYGFGRIYKGSTRVPGIAADPTQKGADRLWYKRKITLPKGDWSAVTLELKGARFRPAVFIDGDSISMQEGGMAPVYFTIRHPKLTPGNTITLEIALQSLKDVPATDASFIPPADQWRSNNASTLWDDVNLYVHGTGHITSIIPFHNEAKRQSDLVFSLGNVPAAQENKAVLELIGNDKILLKQEAAFRGANHRMSVQYNNLLQPWSPEHPNLYSLRLSVYAANGKCTDSRTIPFGVRQFEMKDKKFYLNRKPFTARGGTVVWHRWVRTEDGRKLGYDTAWFVKNIIGRLKGMGANYLRFHLGKPPEVLLDLCDRYGLVVQYEWNFFHGMPASKESLEIQYKNWLDVAVKHPSVCMIHPYNETEGDQLKTVWSVLDSLLPQYPPMVLEDREVLHIHKYWWSLFENLGLYYDSAAQFPKAIMVDEFGGNYLDEKGDPGAYTTVKETLLRFLGREHTATDRLAFQAAACGKVAEYWRRIGAAGFAPFCILSSWDDGNNWFLGDLQNPQPKPVWKALAPAFAPVSVSMDLWDRNFSAHQKIVVPLVLFNDTDKDVPVTVQLQLKDSSGKIVHTASFTHTLAPFSRKRIEAPVTMPGRQGNYSINACLVAAGQRSATPVRSEWNLHVLTNTVPPAVKQATVYVHPEEKELTAFLQSMNIGVTHNTSQPFSIVLAGAATWKKLSGNDAPTRQFLDSCLQQNRSVVLLDAGDSYLGQGYLPPGSEEGPLQGVMKIKNAKPRLYPLMRGLSLSCTQVAEPESHIQPAASNNRLWEELTDDHTRLWNGLRGGLIAPAIDMKFTGLDPAAFIEQWKSRGAEEKAITEGAYYGYELQGTYAFSRHTNDSVVIKALKQKLRFLYDDAPALAMTIDTAAGVQQFDLHRDYLAATKGDIRQFTPLASCGKGLTRVPVSMVSFRNVSSRLLVSQLLTAGRLAAGFGSAGLYGIREDAAAKQMVLNMIALAMEEKE